MHRQGRKSTAGTGPIEGMGVGTTTFKSALKKCEARAVASRGDDERVFDSLHRAGIDIKLVGNPTNGFSSL
jgi:hypothetical protein